MKKFCENIKLPKEVGTLVINIPVVCESQSLRTEVLKNIVPSFPSCTAWLSSCAKTVEKFFSAVWGYIKDPTAVLGSYAHFRF